MSTKKIRLVLVLCVITLLMTAVLTILNNPYKNTRVGEEKVQCLSAVCLVDHKGIPQCFEFSPKMAHVYSVEDVNERGASRLMVTLNSNRCRG